MGRLDNKVAMITGGCSGIGLASVELFVAEGASVVVADMQDEKGRMLEQRFRDRVAYIHCDVTREEHIVAATQLAASRFGGLDIQFNNAGTGGVPSTVEDTTVEGWDATMALLLRGPMLGMKHAVPLMRARGGGSIVNTASIAGLVTGWGYAYSVAKAAVIQLTKAAAVQLAVQRIRVNAICPGVIVTPIFGVAVGLDRAVADQAVNAYHDAAARMQPIRRAGEPADIARAALYFASDDSSFVTGTYQVVDGGITLGERTAWDENAVSPIMSALAEIAGDPG